MHAGYGNTYPNECWGGVWLLMVHQVIGMILNAITVGIIFARVSYPQTRGRTIAISDTAVIARRDGLLKFMFRIADIRQSQVRLCLLTPCLAKPSCRKSLKCAVCGRRHCALCSVYLEYSYTHDNTCNPPYHIADYTIGA